MDRCLDAHGGRYKGHDTKTDVWRCMTTVGIRRAKDDSGTTKFQLSDGVSSIAFGPVGHPGDVGPLAVCCF